MIFVCERRWGPLSTCLKHSLWQALQCCLGQVFNRESRSLFRKNESFGYLWWHALALASSQHILLVVLFTVQNGETLISPSGNGIFDEDLLFIVLGHFSENHGEHYVSLHHQSSHRLNQSITKSEGNPQMLFLLAGDGSRHTFGVVFPIMKGRQLHIIAVIVSALFTDIAH